jgi:hypothetical protein
LIIVNITLKGEEEEEEEERKNPIKKIQFLKRS